MDKQNENYSNNPADLKSYEKQIDDKKSFLGDLFSKIKNKREQKLLNSGAPEKTQTTSQSISFLWGVGSFRKSLFDTLENIRKSLFQKNNVAEVKNTLDTHIIGENSPENTFEKTLDNSETSIDVIVPVSKSVSKNNAKGPITLPNQRNIDNQQKTKIKEDENISTSNSEEGNSSSSNELKIEIIDDSAVINERNMQSNIPQQEFAEPKESEEAKKDSSEKDDR